MCSVSQDLKLKSFTYEYEDSKQRADKAMCPRTGKALAEYLAQCGGWKAHVQVPGLLLPRP